jgi:hypothetical protein
MNKAGSCASKTKPHRQQPTQCRFSGKVQGIERTTIAGRVDLSGYRIVSVAIQRGAYVVRAAQSTAPQHKSDARPCNKYLIKPFSHSIHLPSVCHVHTVPFHSTMRLHCLSFLHRKTPSSILTTTRSSISILPLELLQEIFSHASFLDLVCCRLTCSHWHAASAHHFQPYARLPNRCITPFSGKLRQGCVIKQPTVLNVRVATDGSERFTTHGVSFGKGRTNPILHPQNRRDLYYLSSRQCKKDKWTHMFFSMPPISRLFVSMKFEGDEGEGIRFVEVQRSKGVRIVDVAGCVGREVEGMRRERG